MKFIDWKFVIVSIPKIIEMVPFTLSMLGIALVFGIVIAFAAALCRVHNVRFFNRFFAGYVSFIRGTPFIIQLFLIYYAMPSILFKLGIDINNYSKTFFVILTFVINSGAYISEIFRSALLSVEEGQSEAAYSIGLNGAQTFFLIVFPQAMKMAIPNFGSTLISLIKETSIAFNIGIVDIMGKAKIISGYSYRFFETYVAVAIVYWVINICVELIFGVVNYKINCRGRADNV